MGEREKLSQLFETIGQAFLELSRIMLKLSEKDVRHSKKENALLQKRKRAEERTREILMDLNRPHPETNPRVNQMLKKFKEKL